MNVLSKVLPLSSYIAYKYKHDKKAVLERRGVKHHVGKGDIFHIRQAHSDKNKMRVMIPEYGPTKLFSIHKKDAEKLLKRSKLHHKHVSNHHEDNYLLDDDNDDINQVPEDIMGNSTQNLFGGNYMFSMPDGAKNLRAPQTHDSDPSYSKVKARLGYYNEKAANKWSGRVRTHFHPKHGLFTKGINTITKGLRKGESRHSTGTLIRRLTFYLNRGGHNISSSKRSSIKKRINSLHNKLLKMG